MVIAILAFLPNQALCKAPKDDYFHIVLLARGLQSPRIRIGYDQIEVGHLHESAIGIVTRFGNDILTAGLGIASGSDGFGPSGPGLFSEVGLHHLAMDWLDLRFDCTNFVGLNGDFKGQLFIGLGLHF